ncbi:MAG TPA: ABC transporter ATP-binding protein [Gemmatimonadales bacterium]
MTHAVAIQHLHYRAGKRFAIPDLTLTVPTGAIYGFLGPNGSGKTTTIRLMLGMLRPAGGTITVLGHGVPNDVPRALARIGYVPEQPHVDPTLTIDETMRFHAAFFSTWDWPWARQLAATFALDGGQPFGRLSKGEKGKLLMLLALAQRPELLVLDEPTEGLDPVVRRDLLAAIIEYVSQREATVFISSHLIHELERFCDWVAVMDDGRLAAEVPMERFKNSVKRLRIANPPRTPGDTPFVLLARESTNGRAETWIVRDWAPAMAAYFERTGSSLDDIIDLDLEEAFVEVLRAFRARNR